MKGKWVISSIFALVLTLGCSVAYGQNVKVTPLHMEVFATSLCKSQMSSLAQDRARDDAMRESAMITTHRWFPE